MLLELGISVFSASGDWLGLVVVMFLTGGCFGTHMDTHRNTHKGAHGQPQTAHIAVFEFGWVWLWDGPGLVVAAVR
jgi:hypothetical protein